MNNYFLFVGKYNVFVTIFMHSAQIFSFIFSILTLVITLLPHYDQYKYQD